MEEFWVLSLSGVPVRGATQALAEKRAREIERPYGQEFDDEAACGNFTASEIEDMRHPTW